VFTSKGRQAAKGSVCSLGIHLDMKGDLYHDSIGKAICKHAAEEEWRCR
jgi:hypothetical protein